MGETSIIYNNSFSEMYIVVLSSDDFPQTVGNPQLNLLVTITATKQFESLLLVTDTVKRNEITNPVTLVFICLIKSQWLCTEFHKITCWI